jgi:Na+/phosphate symporter
MNANPVSAEHDARRTQIIRMSEQTVEMLRIVRDAFQKQDHSSLALADRLGREIHREERALMETLITEAEVSTRPASEEDTVFVPMHLERVGDNLESLVSAVRKMITDGVLFTDRAMREVSSLFEIAHELLECVRDALRTGNRTLIRHILLAGLRCELMANDFALFHEQRLIEGVCLPRASSVYLAMLDYLKGIEWHVRQIGEKLTPSPLHEAEAGHRFPSLGTSAR